MTRSHRFYGVWAAKAAELFNLNDGQARMLYALAAYVDPDGVVRQPVALLAKRAGRGKRRAEELLAELEGMRLMTTRRRGQRTAWRTLNTELLPGDQLDLFEGQKGAVKTSSEGVPDPHTEPQSALSNPHFSGSRSAPPGGADHRVKGTTEGEDAREPTSSVIGLAETLQCVLDILATAPRLAVEPMAVNAMLLAHPEQAGYVHQRAAWTVVSWAHEGGLSMSSAPRLLQRALLKQLEQSPARASRFDRPAASTTAAAATVGPEHDAGLYERSVGW